MTTQIPKISKRIVAREKNAKLGHRTLAPTPENRALVRDYEQLAREITEFPARALGLRMNYRKRDIPMALARLNEEREGKMKQLLDMEKVLFPKKA